MDFDYLMFIVAVQMLSIGSLAVCWAGVYLIRDQNDPAGYIALLTGIPWLLLLVWLLLSRRGWLDFGLALGLPALASIPAYWLYRSGQRSRVFIWILVALWPASVTLGLSVHFITSDEGGAGCWGLLAAALVSVLVVYGYRKLYLRRLTLSPAELQRAARDPWGTIGGLASGVLAAVLSVVISKLAPQLQAAVNAFIAGLAGFSILGCAAWRFLWEIRQRRG